MADSEASVSAEAEAEAAGAPAGSYSPEDRSLAREASALFRRGDAKSLDACQAALKRLLANHAKDPKLVLNRAVLDYTRSGLLKTEEFLASLATAADLTGLPLDRAEELDDVDQVVIFYNCAVVAFWQRQFRKADAIISRTVPFSEPLEESFSRRQSLLHLEVLLRLQEAERALKHCASVEKALAAAQDSDTEALRNDKFKAEVLLYKIKALLMNRSMKLAKKEIKQYLSGCAVSRPVLFLKAQFEFLRRNSRKAVKIIGSVPDSLRSPVECGESDSVMHWSNLGCLHLQMGKHNLAVLYFRKALRENEKLCQEFQAKKHGRGPHNAPLKAHGLSAHHQLALNLGLALLFSGKPLAAFDFLLEVINVYSRNPRLWLRLAECCIKVHKPSNDMDRELSARLRAVQRSAGVGLHRKLVLGAGVASVKKPWEESAAMPSPTLEFASLCVRNALLLLPKEPDPPGPENDDERRGRLSRWAEELRLPLQPAGFLRGLEVLQLRNSALTAAAFVALSLSDFLGARLFAQQLLQQPCLTGAQRYLGRMYLAEAHVFSDRIPDALALLNHETVDSVAVVLESAAASPGTPASVPGLGEDAAAAEAAAEEAEGCGGSWLPRWEPSNAGRARGLMLFNMAAALAIREDYAKARPLMNKAVQLTGMPLPAHFYFLRLYLDLMMGDRVNAQAIIKDMFGHLTINQRQCFANGRPPSLPLGQPAES